MEIKMDPVEVLEKKYTITLDDGTKIQNIRLNGSTFVSNEEIKSNVFERKLETVTVSDGENEWEYKNVKFIQALRTDHSDHREWEFVLIEMTPQEIENRKLRADVDFLSMMIDVNI